MTRISDVTRCDLVTTSSYILYCDFTLDVFIEVR
jgi:hypothetical protein